MMERAYEIMMASTDIYDESEGTQEQTGINQAIQIIAESSKTANKLQQRHSDTGAPSRPLEMIQKANVK